MRYMVQVNARYMVGIEAETPLEAEHKILNEYAGCWAAMAFDREAMKTETFADTVATCETISTGELQELAREYAAAVRNYKKAVEAVEKKLVNKRLAFAGVLAAAKKIGFRETPQEGGAHEDI